VYTFGLFRNRKETILKIASLGSIWGIQIPIYRDGKPDTRTGMN